MSKLHQLIFILLIWRVFVSFNNVQSRSELESVKHPYVPVLLARGEVQLMMSERTLGMWEC